MTKRSLKHTAQFALSFNIKIVDDAGRDVSAWIMPVVYWWLWIPAWLCACGPACTWAGGASRPVGASANRWGRQELRPRRRLAPIRRAPFWLFDLAGWQSDLRLIGLAAWLLVRDRGFYGAAI